ncbi:Uncharacterised protein [Mycobacterium tuberculosis]|nr:Uncharacterised protein [Mycobacterium tuberculosis]
MASSRSPARWISWSSFFPVLPLPKSSSARIALSWWTVDANSRSFASLAAAASNSELTFLMIVVICSRLAAPPSLLSRNAFDSSSRACLMRGPLPLTTSAPPLSTSATGPAP